MDGADRDHDGEPDPDAALTAADAPAKGEGPPAGTPRGAGLRKVLPYVWRRRWLFAATFALMCVFSLSLQLRNLVPGVFFDGVLLPGLGGGESFLPPSFRRVLAPFGIDGERQRPLHVNGAFTDLVFERYVHRREEHAGKHIFEDGEASFTVVVGDERQRIGPLAFSELTVHCNAAQFQLAPGPGPDEALVAGIAAGSLKLELKPAGGLGRKTSLLWTLVFLGLVVCALIFASRYGFKYLEQHVLQHIVADLRRDLIGHMSTLSLSFYNNRSRGDLLSRLSNDLTRVNLTLQLIFEDLVLQPIIFVTSAAVCLWIHPWLGLLVIAAFPILFLLMARAGRKVRRRSHKQSAKRGLMTTAVEQLFSGIRTVKSFNMEEHEREHFQEKNLAVVRQSLRTAHAKIFANTTVELASHVGIIVVLAVGGFFLVNDRLGLSTGELVFFIASVNTMYQPVKVLAKAYTSFQESMGAMDRVMEIFAVRPAVVDAEGAEPMPHFESSIRYEHVSFSYGREPVLHDIDFEIGAGTLTAIVGPTGAGKSTVVDLLLRFYDPTTGRILVDGRDIRSFTIRSLTSQIAVVSQDPFLFDTTVATNIGYGRTGATREEIEEAARMANVHDFIAALPQGYDTPIGDRGVMLSGGQRQRLTIARALIKDAPILILDEATSSLDSESEAAVQEALEKLIRVRSTIAIAHRLSTIVRADQILVLDHGRIVERGIYRELMDRRGLFYRLYSKQARAGDGAGREELETPPEAAAIEPAAEETATLPEEALVRTMSQDGRGDAPSSASSGDAAVEPRL